MTTNGMLLDGRRLEDLRGRVDVLAISLDGVPAAHDRMRGRAGAFEAMATRLEGVRAAGITFGFIFTLTQHNLDELEWIAQFALEQGASLLQIHPLEEVGRASDLMANRAPDAVEAAFAALATVGLREAVGDRIKVQLDFADADSLARPAGTGLHGGVGDRRRSAAGRPSCRPWSSNRTGPWSRSCTVSSAIRPGEPPRRFPTVSCRADGAGTASTISSPSAARPSTR